MAGVKELSSEFVQNALTNIDQSEPLTVGVLVKLMQAQSEFLLQSFNRKLSERDDIIDKQNESIRELKQENIQLKD